VDVVHARRTLAHSTTRTSVEKSQYADGESNIPDATKKPAKMPER
jgi:hypothetical protein